MKEYRYDAKKWNREQEEPNVKGDNYRSYLLVVGLAVVLPILGCIVAQLENPIAVRALQTGLYVSKNIRERKQEF